MSLKFKIRDTILKIHASTIKHLTNKTIHPAVVNRGIDFIEKICVGLWLASAFQLKGVESFFGICFALTLTACMFTMVYRTNRQGDQ